jgi:hypothetical protein
MCRSLAVGVFCRSEGLKSGGTMIATEITRLLMSFFGGDYTQGFPYARRRVSLNDCASAIIYSRRRKVFLEADWFPAASYWIFYRVVADLGRTAMDY